MDGDEDHNPGCGDEVDGARRLPAAKHIEKDREGGVHAWRHGEPGEEHERQENQRDDEIGKLLQHVIAFGLLALGESKPGMLADRGADMLEVAACWSEIVPKMAAAKAPKDISEAVEQEEPGEEEMPAPAGGEVAMPGQGDGPGKASLIDVTLGIRSGAKHAVGVENVAEDAGDAFDVIAVLRSAHGENGIVEGRFRPEIERRMSVEDLETAHQEHEEDQRIDPVRDPHRARMTIDDLACNHRNALHLPPPPALGCVGLVPTMTRPVVELKCRLASNSIAKRYRTRPHTSGRNRGSCPNRSQPAS